MLPTELDAVLLAGGRGSRLGGIRKWGLTDGDGTLLEHAHATVADARTVVIVGPPAVVPTPTLVAVSEYPRWGGPAAALGAALALLVDSPAAYVLVLATDLAETRAAVPALLAAIEPSDGADGWLACDESGRRQPLLAVYRRRALVAAFRTLGDPDGAGMKHLLAPLALASATLPASLTQDVDTPEDLERLGLQMLHESKERR